MTMKKIINYRWLLCCWLLVVTSATASTYASPPDTLNRKRLTWLIAGAGVSYTASVIMLNTIWYSQYDKQSFGFFNDFPEWKQMDKAGHVFSAYQLTSVSSHMLQGCGVSKRKASVSSAITSFVVMSSIEVMDGFSAGYGASVSDLAANAIGTGLFVGQQWLWHDIRIYPKYSFHRTRLAPLRTETLGHGLGEEIIKDYNGQTQWLSIDMDKFLPFPKWLNLAVGYGAHNMIYARDSMNEEYGLQPYRQLYAGIDFDLTAIKTRSRLVNTLIYFANMIRLPAPALEFSQRKVKAHLFYF
jgi:uncharacterized protein YfiM (DUF2279 family)